MKVYPELKSILVVLIMIAGLSTGQAAETQAVATIEVKIQTNYGDILLELYPDKAPKTVNSFLNYVDTDFYTNTLFHRVIDEFMIQGGGFTQQFERKPTSPPVINEADNGLLNEPGTIAMARTSEPHSATAQFFINLKSNEFLNHTAKTPRGWGYTVFGKVIKGMDVVDSIRQLPTGPGGPFQRDVPKSPAIIIGISRMQTDNPQVQPANKGKTK